MHIFYWVIMMKCSVDMPYPEIKVERKNLSLAKKLLAVYAGKYSEDTNIHNYIYQTFILEKDKEIKKIFMDIAIVEMHHLEMLGKLIKKLGVLPMFLEVKNNQPVWFSGNYVQYSNHYKDILLHNIQLEKITIQNYEKIIYSTRDVSVQHILKRIILDERLHIEIFTKLYQMAE